MPSLRIQLSALAAAVLGAAAVQAAPSHGGVAAVSSASQTGSGEGDVKIGIMDTISTAVDTASLREGLVLLSNPLEKDFRISWRDIVTPDAAQEVLHQKPDFLMLPTEQIDLMEEQGVQTFRIATRKPWTATDAAHAVGSLVARGAPLPIIFLTGHGDVNMAVHALQHGAFDFLQKPVDPEKLNEVVSRAVEHSIALHEQTRSEEMIRAFYDSLTAREQDVVKLAAMDMSNKDIGEKLFISLPTVKMHRSSAFTKLGVKSALEAYWMLETIGVVEKGAGRSRD